DLGSVHPVGRGEREQLHHVGSAAAAPGVPRNRNAVDGHREPAEELDLHRGHRREMVRRSPGPGHPPVRNAGGTVVFLPLAPEGGENGWLCTWMCTTASPTAPPRPTSQEPTPRTFKFRNATACATSTTGWTKGAARSSAWSRRRTPTPRTQCTARRTAWSPTRSTPSCRGEHTSGRSRSRVPRRPDEAGVHGGEGARGR